MNRRSIGSHFWPHTRIRRRGMAASQGRRMRGFLKGASGYLVIFFVFSLGYVWTRVQVIETGYRLRNLEVVGEKLKEENRSLMVEAATLRSLQRLEGIAAKMGLKRPTERQVIYLQARREEDTLRACSTTGPVESPLGLSSKQRPCMYIKKEWVGEARGNP